MRCIYDGPASRRRCCMCPTVILVPMSLLGAARPLCSPECEDAYDRKYNSREYMYKKFKNILRKGMKLW